MRVRAHVVLLIAFFASLAFNLVLHGGLVRLPEGRVFLESARRESPLALAYMTLGEWVVAIPGVAGVGESLARSAYGPAFADALATPTAASDLIETGRYGQAHAFARALYWATPLLFFAWVVAFWLRPREVHLVRRGR